MLNCQRERPLPRPLRLPLPPAPRMVNTPVSVAADRIETDLGSSKGYPAAPTHMEGVGMFGTEPFDTHTIVYNKYCDGGSWSGAVGNPPIVYQNTTLYFRGPPPSLRPGPHFPSNDYKGMRSFPSNITRAGPHFPFNDYKARPHFPSNDYKGMPALPSNITRAGPSLPSNGYKGRAPLPF